jgi:glutamate-1-semialdehyde aminotransferase
MMQKYATEDVIPQGTYARNSVSLAAADATLDEIKRGYVNSNVEKFGNALMKSIRELLKDMKIDDAICSTGIPSMFQVLFTKQDRVDNYRDFIKSNNDLFTKLQKRILTKGILVDENEGEPLYTSSAHKDNNDLKQILEAFEASLPFLRMRNTGH